MNLKSTIEIPEDVKFILRVLNSAGYQAFIVGGCVRDSIMGRVPGDWDITTNAKPREVKFLFSRTIDTGIKHGTVTVVVNGTNYEVTTYRIEGQYIDSRHPESVEFTSSLKMDLARRDFTINSIAYHPEEGFVDPFGGINDIGARIIRAVGNPQERFREDALRMLRAVRFSAQLDFTIEHATFMAIKENNSLILNISSERIRDEITKTLTSPHPEKVLLLRELEMLEKIIPEFDACFGIEQNNPYHVYNLVEHTINAVAAVEKDPVLRWTMLLHDTGKVDTKTTDEKKIDHFYEHQAKSAMLAEDVLKRLKFDNKTIDRVCRLIKHHDRYIESTEKAVRKAVNVVGEDIFIELLKVKEADVSAQNPKNIETGIAHINEIKHLYEEIKRKGQCLSLKDLALNGDDLIKLGFTPGKNIGEALENLLEQVIETPELNEREKLVNLITYKN